MGAGTSQPKPGAAGRGGGGSWKGMVYSAQKLTNIVIFFAFYLGGPTAGRGRGGL